MVTCGGCYRRGPNLVFPSPYISPFCLHEPHLCLDCVKSSTCDPVGLSRSLSYQYTFSGDEGVLYT
ncbi:hypothetical protein GGR55DRAFT_671165 [Xylaria sp. FL0064]|nr:hypothetical protein GGR55DRAFT_671165 [Xylaria sp. FL0064]